jgi:hypothetical protein
VAATATSRTLVATVFADLVTVVLGGIAVAALEG